MYIECNSPDGLAACPYPQNKLDAIAAHSYPYSQLEYIASDEEIPPKINPV
jgi:hypothetical protein